jgi:hypothetical protein
MFRLESSEFIGTSNPLSLCMTVHFGDLGVPFAFVQVAQVPGHRAIH